MPGLRDGATIMPMRRIALPLVVGALICTGVLAFALSPREVAAPSAGAGGSAPAPGAEVRPVRPPAPTVATAVTSPPAVAAGPPAPPPGQRPAGNNDLLALEDQALRRIDVAPVLERAGVDVRALAARPDGEDVLRHAAADELLTRALMRDLFSLTVYPYGYPEDHAQAEARDIAQGIIAKLSAEDRANMLQRALAGYVTDVPEPYFWSADSGHVFDGHFRNEPARN